MSFPNGTIGEIIKVLDMAGVEMLAISLPDSRIVDVTSGLAKTWNCSKYEVVGAQLSQSESSPLYAHYVNTDLAGLDGSAELQVEIVKRPTAGGAVTRKFKPKHHKDGDKQYLLLIGKQTATVESNNSDDTLAQLRLAVEAGGYSSLEIDYGDNELTIDDEIFSFFGMDAKVDQMSLAKWLALVHPDDFDLTLTSMINSTPADQKYLQTSYRVKHRDGHYVWLEMIARAFKDPITKNVTKIIGLCRDISRQMHQRHRTETSEQNLARSQALAKMGSWVMNLQNHTVDWSDHMYALFGVPKGGETRNDFESLISLMDPAEQEKWKESLDFAKLGQSISGLECEFNHPDGEKHRISIHIDIEYDAAGKPAKLHGICQDITDQTLLERKFLQAQKMESVGQLTGGIAHDFNNLLMVVLGNLQLIEKLTADDEKAATRLTTAIDAVNKGSELTKRLLAFSRQQTLEDEVIDVNALIEETSDMITRAINSEIRLKINPGENIWQVKADKTQLETAILNLSINARDAMKDGGTLIVETENKVLETSYTKQHEDLIPGEYVVISVSDTGEGIPPDIIDKVLQPFFTTKGPGSGSGLGLSMIYGFVKQSKGHLGIHSQEGTGTTIRIYLPRHIADTGVEPTPIAASVNQPQHPVMLETEATPEPVVEPAHNPVPAPAPQANPKQDANSHIEAVVEPEPIQTQEPLQESEPVLAKEPDPATIPQAIDETPVKKPIVLIAEDNDPVRDVAVAMIEDMDYVVLDAADGEKALEIIKTRDDIDLLLSDVVMPGMNGPELAAAALEIRPELKVLFASGYTQGTAEEMHELPNFIELIDKPFTQHELTSKVRAAVESQMKKDAA